MLALLRFFQAVIALPFKSRQRLEAENAALRHQLINAPVSRPIQRTGGIRSNAILGGLHHHYVRV